MLELQHYRLAHWTTGTESLDYRRFFDVSDLIGLQTQLEPVFEATHARILQWVADGDVDGLRVDHPDGLADPTGYAQQLAPHARPARGSWSRRSSPGARSCRRPGRWTAPPVTRRSCCSTGCSSIRRAKPR